MKRILVITPTLGASPWLEETVASVTRFAAFSQHVLVAPAAQMEELVRRFPTLTVVPDPGGGMYAAINAGLAKIPDWDAFTYINDDDLLLPGFGQLLKRLPHGLDGVHYGRVRMIDAEGQALGRIPISRNPRLNAVLYRSGIEPVYQHGTVIPRRVLEKVGRFDESYRLCGDSEWLARACLGGCRFTYCSSDVAAFRIRSGQLSRNVQAMGAERERFRRFLGPQPCWRRRVLAVVAFRAGNIGVYLARVFRYGWTTANAQQTTS